MSTYTVQVFRVSDQWVIEMPDLDIVGQTRTLAGAAETARGLIALWLDVDPAVVEVVMDYSRVDPDAAGEDQISAAAAVALPGPPQRLVGDAPTARTGDDRQQVGEPAARGE